MMVLEYPESFAIVTGEILPIVTMFSILPRSNSFCVKAASSVDPCGDTFLVPRDVGAWDDTAYIA